MGQFKFLPKEKTTEPSVEKKLKRGGHAKKHMALGGVPSQVAPIMRRPAVRTMTPKVSGMPALLRKKGGEVESHKEHKAEMHEMHKIEKELKHHEKLPAKKAHHGLKAGGMYHPQMGGLLDEGHPHHVGKTGAGIEGPGYKHGGKIHHISGHPEGSHKHHMHMAKHHAAKHAEGGSAHHKKMHEHHKHMAKMCKGGKYAIGGEAGTQPVVHEGGAHLKRGGHAKHHMATGGTLHPKINVQDKVVEAKQVKGFNTKTSAKIAGTGYKRGGHLKKAMGGTISEKEAEKHLNMMHDGSKKHTKAGKTGEIHQAPAGYKKGGHVKHHAHGGHVMHHTTHGHDEHGHTPMHHHSTKIHHHGGHSKLSAHPMKKGGKAKCNY